MMHNERQATKVQLTNRGIKPKEDRHQRIGDNTLIMPKQVLCPTRKSCKRQTSKTKRRNNHSYNKVKRRLKRRRDFGGVQLYSCRSIASITGLEQVSKPHNLLRQCKQNCVTALIFYSFPLICVQISYLHTNKRSLSQAKLHNLEPISKFYSKLL